MKVVLQIESGFHKLTVIVEFVEEHAWMFL